MRRPHRVNLGSRHLASEAPASPRVSTVLARTGTRVIVEQEAVARVMLFLKRVHLLLEIDERPDALRFRESLRAPLHEV